MEEDPQVIMGQESVIRASECPGCVVCGSGGSHLYKNLTDRLFGAPGKWNLRKCDNVKCRLLWLDPMPLEADLGKLYVNYYTHEVQISQSTAKAAYRRAIDSYLRIRFGYGSVHRVGMVDRLLAALLYLHPGARSEAEARVMRLPCKPGGRLLEIGFGNAQSLLRMLDFGWDVEGVEFDPVAVENARAKNLKVHLGSLASVKLPAESFDAVVSSHVIEHVPDPASFLQECHRLLKPKGTLVAYTPSIKSLGHRIFARNWRGLEPPRHLHLFNSATLHTLVRRAGFSETSCLSSARGGNTLVASYFLRTGSIGDVPLARGVTRLIVELTHYASWAASKLDMELGEELILVARKSKSMT